MPVDRHLTEALLEVVQERLEQDGTSVSALAERMGVQRPTLSRQLRGIGVLTVDEWEALALALGDERLEELLTTARRRM